MEKIGEVAHIHAANPTGPRYLSSQSDQERHGFDNLLILCEQCADDVDSGNNAATNYPASLLRRWKNDHLKKVQGKTDRNWICYPNVATELRGKISIQTKFWIDQQGRPQLYTAEQLAIVEQLSSLITNFLTLNSMLGMIEQTEGEPANASNQTINDGYIGQLYQQFRTLKKTDAGWLGHLAETLQIAGDIKLGEVFLMLVKDGLAERDALRDKSKSLLRDRADETDPTPRLTMTDK